MPIYEYECSSCHHQFDVMQKMNSEPEKKCPECQKDTAKRLISAAGFQLKGTGWYATDFKDKGKPPQKNKPSESSGTDASETGSKGVSSKTKGDAG